jgi:hypothetical protein
MMDFFAAPSFQDGRGSDWANASMHGSAAEMTTPRITTPKITKKVRREACTRETNTPGLPRRCTRAKIMPACDAQAGTYATPVT